MPEQVIQLTKRDPRLSTEYGIGLQRGEANSVNVALVLFEIGEPGLVKNIHLGTPAGMRELAKGLIKVAKEADAIMNRAVVAKGSN